MTTVISHPYSYTTSNTDLIKLLSLQKHPEGGYFNQTLSLQSHIPAKSQSTWPEDLPRSNELGTREHVFVGPAARVLVGEEGEDAQGEESKVDATVIYYLLTPDSYRGRMHMNLHSHLHIHHAGRAVYTLIKPPMTSGGLPVVHRIVLGADIANGERTQLFVPGGWWKASEIPEEDLLLCSDGEAERGTSDKIGCLISEVVIPGWNIEQHQFIDENKLKDMWAGKSGWEPYVRYLTVGQTE